LVERLYQFWVNGETSEDLNLQPEFLEIVSQSKKLEILF